MKNKRPVDHKPVIHITVLNYDQQKQAEYTRKFMAPLVADALRQTTCRQIDDPVSGKGG